MIALDCECKRPSHVAQVKMRRALIGSTHTDIIDEQIVREHIDRQRRIEPLAHTRILERLDGLFACLWQHCVHAAAHLIPDLLDLLTAKALALIHVHNVRVEIAAAELDGSPEFLEVSKCLSRLQRAVCVVSCVLASGGL